GLMHQAIRNTASPVAFYAFVLSTDVISSFNAHLYNTYILPIRHNNLAYVTTLKRAIGWQDTILHYLQSLFLASGQNELYVLGTSFFMWEQLYKNHISLIPTKQNLTKLASRLEPALDFIHTHYQEEITLSMLAACAFLSVSEFCRAFKSLTGSAPIAYLVRYRIQQSCIALSQTTLSVSEIALSHGFNNISYYNRTFAKLIGVTPSAYRSKMIHS
ncbi:MAG: helix-turn-helix transcriptional regulator, partial [Acetatifactor sp.]